MLGKNKSKGIRRLISASFSTSAGIKAAWSNEEAFRQEIIIGVLIVPIGIWMGDSFSQKALLIGVYFTVPVVELLNSAIEAVVDRIGEEHHLLSARAKDMGSAAVFLSICITLILWGTIAYERFFK